MRRVAVGVDIGGTNTQVAAVDLQGEIVDQQVFDTRSFDSFHVFFKKLVLEIKRITRELSIVGIGLGAPAGNRFSGTIQSPANLGWSSVIPIQNLLQAEFGCLVIIDNDANAAAIGESIYGVARESKNQITITLGTGLGSGIIIDGKIVYGSNGFAGELGHISVRNNGRSCGCGKNGCLETYASASGIKRTILELMANTQLESVFRTKSPDSYQALDIYVAANAGDKLAALAFQQTGEVLGEALANFTAFCEPDLFILFGGLAHAGDLLLRPTKVAFHKHLLFLYKEKTNVVLSELMNKNAAILGAAALIWAEA